MDINELQSSHGKLQIDGSFVPFSLASSELLIGQSGQSFQR